MKDTIKGVIGTLVVLVLMGMGFCTYNYFFKYKPLVKSTALTIRGVSYLKQDMQILGNLIAKITDNKTKADAVQYYTAMWNNYFIPPQQKVMTNENLDTIQK